HILEQRHGEAVRKGQVELSGDQRQYGGRQVLDDRILDAVEIRPILLPVIRVPRYLDVFVRSEPDEFERTGADRLLAHVARRHVAGIDRREPGSESGEEGRLRSFQTESDLIVAVGGDPFDVAVPGLARID